mmetsp:Transcript_39324/g.123946  ORF Transcript_39324/g.123946 Transcript_39324/m.123946 type:complete len:252 (-) Transcript_39324:287-1042(-)
MASPQRATRQRLKAGMSCGAETPKRNKYMPRMSRFVPPSLTRKEFRFGLTETPSWGRLPALPCAVLRSICPARTMEGGRAIRMPCTDTSPSLITSSGTVICCLDPGLVGAVYCHMRGQTLARRPCNSGSPGMLRATSKSRPPASRNKTSKTLLPTPVVLAAVSAGTAMRCGRGCSVALSTKRTKSVPARPLSSHLRMDRGERGRTMPRVTLPHLKDTRDKGAEIRIAPRRGTGTLLWKYTATSIATDGDEE